MASYHDPYDSLPRSSPRRDSATRPRDDYYLKPPASGRSDGYSYDPRHSYPPPLGPATGRLVRERRSPHRRSVSWPPVAVVEDEAKSLAKEAGTQKLLGDIGKDPAGSRGTIDQEPIIQDVPELISEQNRRFVVVSDAEGDGKRSVGIPTPPTSEDERVRRRRRRPSRINTDLGDTLPDFQKRTASPYAFTKPTKLDKGPSSSSADPFLSPDVMTPPLTELRQQKQAQSVSASQPSYPYQQSRRLSPNARKGNDYLGAGTPSDDNAIDDHDYDTEGSTASLRRKPPRGSSRKAAPRTSPHTAVLDFGAVPASNATSVPQPNRSSRRQPETATSSPGPRMTEKSHRPTPLMVSSELSDLSDSAIYSAGTIPRTPNLMPPQRSREASHGSRGGSPASASAQSPPQRSPRRRMESSQKHGSSSSSSSRRSSVSVSRPSSPSPLSANATSRLPQTDVDWNTLLAVNALRRGRPSSAKPPSRLSSSKRTESLPEVPCAGSRDTSFASRAPTLPYPMDNGPGTPSAYMPSWPVEPLSQRFVPKQATLTIPLAYDTNTVPRDPSPSQGNSKPAARPKIVTRHSVAGVSPTEERQPFTRQERFETKRVSSYSGPTPTKKEIAALLSKGLPTCPRAEPTSAYDDWYTLVGAPSLDFCPDCIDNVFERTAYRPSFRRSPPRNLDQKVQCALGTPWIRLAWLLTLQRQIPDLTLIRDLANIGESSEPCPGEKEAVRSWYGLRDPDGLFVRDFHVCYTDVRKIERLLPTLSGLFVRLPHRASYEKRKCAIRAEGNRFQSYLDAIIAMHDKATTSRKLPDPMPFINLVEHKLRLRECERDNILIGGLWHFIPNVPHLTVCEDCYEEVVEPEVKRNSDVAMRFNRTVQPVYGEGIGSSCQLYSKRMRRVFKLAVRDGDLKYLARKAKERREAELRLQEQYRDIVRRAKRLESRGSGSEDDERSLNRELELITEEWKEKWE